MKSEEDAFRRFEHEPANAVDKILKRLDVGLQTPAQIPVFMHNHVTLYPPTIGKSKVIFTSNCDPRETDCD